MSGSAATFVLVLAFASTALADEIQLRSGGKISGIAREEKDRVVVETGYGTVAFPADQVMSITKGPTPLHAWPGRFAEIEKSRNPQDFLKLAAWARENDLPRYVHGLLTRALELDPDNAEAREALGYVRHRGKWLTLAELRKEQGLVEHDGRWMLPLEKELAERRKLEADARKIEVEAARRERDDARRRAKDEADFRAKVRATEAEREVDRRPGRRRLASVPASVIWSDAYEILLVGRLLGFHLPYTPYFPFSSAVPCPVK